MFTTGNYIYLLIGESGSGKTTIANRLAEEEGLRQLWSYTTRKPRWEGEPGHIFVDTFDEKTPTIAYTKFDGSHYWATAEQVENSDVYIVDPDGLLYFMLRYKGNKTPIVLFLNATKRTRRRRMKQRGDSKEMIRQRLQHDKIAFRSFRESIDLVDDLAFSVFDVPNDDGQGYALIRDYIRWNEENELNTIIRDYIRWNGEDDLNR